MPMSGIAVLFSLIRVALQMYSFLILGSVLLSWFALGGSDHPSISRMQEILTQWTDPYLAPIRAMLSPLTSRIGLDFSPMVGIMILWFIIDRLPL